MINNVEVWRPVVGYEGAYEVSNIGNVRSKDRKVWNGKCYINRKGRILKPSKTTTGYWKVELSKFGMVSSVRVHRLVAYAFIPEIPNKKLINHKDGNPLNNEDINLEWCTHSENVNHAYKNELIPSNFHLHKEQIIKEYVDDGISIRELSRKYDCSNQTITRYLNKRGVRIRRGGEARDKYKIDRVELVKDFEAGLRNVDIAKKYNTNRQLIGVYKNKHKKGELLL